MRAFIERVRAGGPIIGDGALGTMLMARGLRPGVAPETLNLERPEILQAVAREYVEAGAEIVSTNTFGASPLRLAQHGLEAATEAINRAAVDAVQRAADGHAYVAGDIGPSGRVLKPYGDCEPDEVRASYERQARVLADAGVDLFYVETMTDITEATLAIRAARAVAGHVPIVATMTFDRTPRGFFTVMGVSIAQAARDLPAAGADVVGSNCGNGIDAMVEIAREFRARTTAPLAIQSNAGLPERRGSELVYGESPEYTAARAMTLAELGVAVIGGCCGTTPAHIRAIRDAVMTTRDPRRG
jgi:5-methyltetrahydrofolate--homocysteine methyltransferase